MNFGLEEQDWNKIYNGALILGVLFILTIPVQALFGDPTAMFNPLRSYLMVNVLFMVHDLPEHSQRPTVKSVVKGLMYSPTWLPIKLIDFVSKKLKKNKDD